jgi:hypothetical protein
MTTIKHNNTEFNEFVIIDDKKNEPQYAEVSDFVGGMVELCIVSKW